MNGGCGFRLWCSLPRQLSCYLTGEADDRSRVRANRRAAVCRVACDHFSSIDVRPYALATLLVTGTTIALISWLDAGRVRSGLAFVFCSANRRRARSLFTLVVLAYVVYANIARRRGERCGVHASAAARGCWRRGAGRTVDVSGPCHLGATSRMDGSEPHNDGMGGFGHTPGGIRRRSDRGWHPRSDNNRGRVWVPSRGALLHHTPRVLVPVAHCRACPRLGAHVCTRAPGSLHACVGLPILLLALALRSVEPPRPAGF